MLAYLFSHCFSHSPSVYPRLVLNPDLNAETRSTKMRKKFRPYYVVVLLLIRGTYFPFAQSYFLPYFLENFRSKSREFPQYSRSTESTDKWIWIPWKFIMRERSNQPNPFALRSFKSNTGIRLSRYVTSWFNRITLRERITARLLRICCLEDTF